MKKLLTTLLLLAFAATVPVACGSDSNSTKDEHHDDEHHDDEHHEPHACGHIRKDGGKNAALGADKASASEIHLHETYTGTLAGTEGYVKVTITKEGSYSFALSPSGTITVMKDGSDTALPATPVNKKCKDNNPPMTSSSYTLSAGTYVVKLQGTAGANIKFTVIPPHHHHDHEGDDHGHGHDDHEHGHDDHEH